MSTEIKGKVHQVLQKANGINKKNEPWESQQLVIETTDQFPKKVMFEAFGDKTKLIESLQVGSEVTVHFNAESSEYNGKWYTKLKLWKVDGGVQPDYSNVNNHSTAPTGNVPPPADGDLPF